MLSRVKGPPLMQPILCTAEADHSGLLPSHRTAYLEQTRSDFALYAGTTLADRTTGDSHHIEVKAQCKTSQEQANPDVLHFL